MTPDKFPNRRRNTDPMLETLKEAFDAHQESCERKTEQLIELVQAESEKAATWRAATTADIADLQSQFKAAWPQIDAATDLRNSIRHAMVILGALAGFAAFVWQIIGVHLAWH